MHLIKKENIYISFSKEDFELQINEIREGKNVYFLELIILQKEMEETVIKDTLGFLLSKVVINKNEVAVKNEVEFLINKKDYSEEVFLLNYQKVFQELERVIKSKQITNLIVRGQVIQNMLNTYNQAAADVQIKLIDIDVPFSDLFKTFNNMERFFVYIDNYRFRNYRDLILRPREDEYYNNVQNKLLEHGWDIEWVFLSPNQVSNVLNYIINLISVDDKLIVNKKNLILEDETILELRGSNENY